MEANNDWKSLASRVGGAREGNDAHQAVKRKLLILNFQFPAPNLTERSGGTK